MAALCLLTMSGAFAYKVGEARVAIGANLDSEQIAAVYSDFGIERGVIPEITVTNENERQYLEGLVDDKKIGHKAISCVYITILDDGSGLNVSTKNINWCTEQMYKNALTTAGITDADVKVIISPLYREEDVVTRAAGETMLVGAALSCDKEGVSLKKAIELSFELDTELAGKVEVKQYKNGEWVKADSRVEDSHVVVAASEFASYGLFLDVEFSEKKSTEAVEFEQSKWDNLYGSKDMSVGEAAYTYKVGTEISTEGTVSKLTALLIEELAQRFGATATTLNGSYPINVTLPVGTMLEISGVQEEWGVSASALGKSASGTCHGNVVIEVATSNREHTGGGE